MGLCSTPLAAGLLFSRGCLRRENFTPKCRTICRIYCRPPIEHPSSWGEDEPKLLPKPSARLENGGGRPGEAKLLPRCESGRKQHGLGRTECTLLRPYPRVTPGASCCILLLGWSLGRRLLCSSGTCCEGSSCFQGTRTQRGPRSV